MKGSSMKPHQLLQHALFILAVVLLAMPWAWAEHQKAIDGMVVNVGVVPASKAAKFPSETEKHGATYTSAAQHVLVSLSDAKTGGHIADARVTLELRGPKGKSQKKLLVAGSTAGIPDYSEIFDFGWSGPYRIRVTIERQGGKRPVTADLKWQHVVN